MVASAPLLITGISEWWGRSVNSVRNGAAGIFLIFVTCWPGGKIIGQMSHWGYATEMRSLMVLVIAILP